MNRIWLYIFIYLFSCSAFCESRWEGFYKIYYLNEKLNQKRVSLWNQVGRLSYIHHSTDQQTFEVAYELATFSQNESAYFQPQYDYRVKDFSTVIVERGKSVVTQNLDRMFYSYNSANWNLKVGRQPVSFGSGKMVNPIDVLTPLSAYALDSENRLGMDAVRVKRLIGWTGELDGGWVVGDKAKEENNAYFFVYRFPLQNWYSSLTAMRFKKHHLLGLDLQGSWGQQGLWLEWAYVDLNDDMNYTRFVMGLDYRWNDDIFQHFEYHFNGSGKETTDQYTVFYQSKAFLQGGVFLLVKTIFLQELVIC